MNILLYNKALYRFQSFVIHAIFLTLVSLPIMIVWGLPLSYLSPIGNFIFNPFITLFLGLSTIAFFAELFSISHSWIDYSLEQVSSLWRWCLSYDQLSCMVGFSCHALWIHTLIALISFVMLLNPYWSNHQKRFYSFIILLICSLTVNYYATPSSLNHHIVCRKKNIEFVYDNTQTLFIDRGASAEKGRPGQWIQYQVLASIIQESGATHIDHALFLRPTIRALEAAVALCTHSKVLHVYLPAFTGELEGAHKRTFKHLYRICKEKNIRFHTIRYKSFDITLPSLGTWRLTPGKKERYRAITFNTLSVTHYTGLAPDR